MRLKICTSAPMATTIWDRRANALDAGFKLMEKKPDEKAWTDNDWRLWRYALAVSKRLERLN
ncbi:MAG: hypothetical protein R3D57_05305 [Hyphomicrobiaceae bacterium]